MTARILVVDDIEANVRLLEAKLASEYYEVLTASDGPTALAVAAAEKPDIILLDVMMPGMDGFSVCRRLKDDAETRHIPVVLVTALDGRGDRVAGLESGADEFLTKPIDDMMLFARVRSLTRLKAVIDELREREASGRRMGVIAGAHARLGGAGGRILVVDDHVRQAQRVAAELSVEHRPVVETEPDKALLTAKGAVDLIILNTAARGFDGLRLAAQIRSDEQTRNVPVIAVVDFDERPKVMKALEIGVNDILARPIDPQELAARARTQIRRKRYTDYLRDNLDQSLELAVTDQLTGLHNRRYMQGRLEALARRAAAGGEPVGCLVIDIDHFKKINDTYGHEVGDHILTVFGQVLAAHLPAGSFGRMGGEEFVAILPFHGAVEARADEIRQAFARAAQTVLGQEVAATVSIGCARAANTTIDQLIHDADHALYRAKAAGRNVVILSSAVAG